MTSEGEKRKLVDLRVVDLRAELEKRGLESKGVKATLLERLQKVLSDEGHDPEEYLFEIEPAKVPKRSSMKRGEQDTESETQSNADENHDTSMEVDEDGKEKEDEEDDEKIENGKEKETQDSEKSVKQEEKKETNSGSQSLGSSGPENTEIKQEVTPVLASANQVVDGDKSVPEANGVDNEDSINLTIGEDEEKLLADEVGHEEDSSSQEKDAKGFPGKWKQGQKTDWPGQSNSSDTLSVLANDQQLMAVGARPCPVCAHPCSKLLTSSSGSSSFCSPSLGQLHEAEGERQPVLLLPAMRP